MKTSGLQKLSGRYVKALFDVASDASAVASVEKDLLALAKVASTSKEFADFLSNPLLTRKEQADVIAAMLSNIGAHEITRQFAAMLARQKRLPALAEIANLFSAAAASARGEIAAEVVSAKELKAPEVVAIAEKIGKAYGKKVTVKTRVNPELLGGVVIKIGSTQLDSSLSGKLARLELKLKEVA